MRDLYGKRRTIGHCLWCGERLVNGANLSGYVKGPDYMTPDGDFGCGESPDTQEDGTGGHTPDEVPTQDGHVVRIVAYKYVKRTWTE